MDLLPRIIACVVAGVSAGLVTFVAMLCVAALIKYLKE